MTEAQFYEALKDKTTRESAKWRTDYLGSIRTGCHCPLSFVSGGDMRDPTECGNALNLKRVSIKKIILAADNHSCFREDIQAIPRVRRLLLKACGLETGS